MLVSDRGIDLSVQAERHFVLMIAIKAADISNPSRCLHLSRMWSEQIMEEFFRQGDSERTMNLPISFLCDRFSTAIPKSQSGKDVFCSTLIIAVYSNGTSVHVVSPTFHSEVQDFLLRFLKKEAIMHYSCIHLHQVWWWGGFEFQTSGGMRGGKVSTRLLVSVVVCLEDSICPL